MAATELASIGWSLGLATELASNSAKCDQRNRRKRHRLWLTTELASISHDARHF